MIPLRSVGFSATLTHACDRSHFEQEHESKINFRLRLQLPPAGIYRGCFPEIRLSASP